VPERRIVSTSESSQGVVAIVVANTIFGLNIPVTKALVAHWMTPLAYTTIRMVFGAFVFWGLSMVTRSERVTSRDLGVMALGGLLGYVGTQFLFSQSLQYTSPVVYSLLMALTPVFVLLLAAVFLRESIPFRKALGILISLAGAALIILMGGRGTVPRGDALLGIVFAFLCVLSYAGYLVLTRTISVRYQPVTVAKYMFLVSALVVVPFGWSDSFSTHIISSTNVLPGLLLLGFALIFSTLLAFFLMPYALRRIEATTASVFMNLQPIVAAVVAILVGQDSLTWDKPVALLLVLLGVFLVTFRRPSKAS